MKNIFINGFGRIGRLIFRQILHDDGINVVGINDLTSTKNLAYLLEYDSAQGRFMPGYVKYTDDCIVVKGKQFKVFQIKDPSQINHRVMQTDIVIESTGLFTEYTAAHKHIDAGAKQVLISAPAKGDNIKTIVYNVNHEILTPSDKIISAASCTTNCLAPVVDCLDKAFQFGFGLMTTVHSATNDQKVLDLPHKDFRRGRSVLNNIIPTHTGAAAAIGKVLPHLNGKLNGFALRVPTITGSIVDLVCDVKQPVSVASVNEALKAYANDSLSYNEELIVSSDVIGSTYASIFDSTMTTVLEDGDGKQYIKVLAFYDNEYSYVSQYVRTLIHLLKM